MKFQTAISRNFMLRLIEAAPCIIHIDLKDYSMPHPTEGGGGSALPLIRTAMANSQRFRTHTFK
jgi:hypothetical protein